MAEREGFEPPCRLPDKTLSRRPRYDHFGTSPFITTLGGAAADSPTPGFAPMIHQLRLLDVAPSSCLPSAVSSGRTLVSPRGIPLRARHPWLPSGGSATDA